MSGVIDWITGLFSKTPVPGPIALPANIEAEIADIEKVLGFFKTGDWAGFEAAWKSQNVLAEIETGASLIEMFLKIGSVFIPALIIPADAIAIAEFLVPIMLGVGSTMVPDGKGGFVPAHGQSLYDPRTGIFTGKKT
jgi:hypothetical protein